MRRRRQKNPLLMRIVMISILVHIIVLPVLAHYGAFKKIQRQFVEVTAVRLPPPPLPPEKKEQVAKKQPKPKPTHIAQKAKRGSTTTAHQHQAPIRAAANLPHIATAAGGSGGGGFEAQQGTGKMGQIATPVNTAPTQPTVQTTPPPPQPKLTVQPPKPEEKPKEIASLPKPAAPEPKPTEPAPAPKQPVFTEAEPAVPLASEPQPAIPDDLRDEALDKTCVAEVTVGPDGKPTDAKISQSSGSDELDRLALDAARQWKFKPATRDGAPVESIVRIHIEFQVS